MRGTRRLTVNQLAAVAPAAQPSALFTSTAPARQRFVEVLHRQHPQSQHPQTRKAYARAIADFAAWCSQTGLQELDGIEPVHLAAYLEQLQEKLSPPSVKLNLAALRMQFD